MEEIFRILPVRQGNIGDKKMNLKQIVRESWSCSEVLKRLKYKSINGKSIKEIRQILKDNNIDFSHFTKNGNQRKYLIIEKSCPVCNKTFKTKKDHKREKKTCSYACSNKFFRSGPNNGNWSVDYYRTTCFYLCV